MRPSAPPNRSITANGKDYDYNEWRFMIAGEQITLTTDRKGALFAGGTGSGKSTSIAVALDAKFIFNPTTMVYDLVENPNDIPMGADGFSSRTLHITPYGNAGKTLFDSAGLGENRGVGKWLWTVSNLHLFLHTVAELRAIVVTLDFQALKVQRGETLRTLVRQLAPLISVPGSLEDCDWLFDSMVFLMTKATVEGIPLSVDNIKAQFRKALTEWLESLHQFVQKMKKRYPRTGVYQALKKKAMKLSKQVLLVSDMEKLREIADLSEDVAWQKLTPEEEEEYHQWQILIRLGQQITKPTSNVVVATIRDPQSCTQTKQRLEVAFASTPRLSPEKMRLLGTGPLGISDTAILDYFHVLGAMCKEELPLLTRQLFLLSDLSARLKSHEDDLKAVRMNYQVVRQARLDAETTKESELRKSVATKKGEIAALVKCKDLRILRQETVSKERDNQFFSWKVFGGGWAEKTFTYEEHEFAKYRFENDDSLHKEKCWVVRCEPKKGKLELYLESKAGRNLSVDIIVEVETFRHPATKRELELMKKELLIKETELEEVLRRITWLRAISSKEDMTEFIVSGKANVERALDEEQAQFEAKLGEGDSPILAQYIAQLAALLKLLESKLLIPENKEFKPHVKEFCRVYDKIVELTKVGTVIHIYSPTVIRKSHPRAKNQDVLAATPKLSQRVAAVVMDKGVEAASALRHAVAANPGVVGPALLVCLAFGNWSWLRLGLLFLAFALVIIAARSMVMALMEAAVKQKQEVADQFQECVRKTTQQIINTRADATDVLKQFNETLAKNLKVDIKANVDSKDGLVRVMLAENMGFSLFGKLFGLF